MNDRDTHCNENPISVFPEMKLRGLIPNPTFRYLWAIYIFPGPICLFGYSSQMNVEIGRQNIIIYNYVLEITRPRSFISGNT